MIRPGDRVAVMGQGSPLMLPLLSSFATPLSPHVRLISPWGAPRAHTFERVLPGLEQASFNAGDFESLRRAMRACNALILLSEPEGDVSSAVRLMRHIAQACRDTEVERMVFVSCASMLGSAPGQFLRHEQALPSLDEVAATRWRYMLELEFARFAADAMDIVGLYPGLVWMPEHPACAKAVRGAHASSMTSVISAPHFASRCHATLERGRAGQRYGLGMCNVQVAALQALLPTRDLSARPPAAQIARFAGPLRAHAVLDTGQARRELGLRAVPSLAALSDEDAL